MITFACVLRTGGDYEPAHVHHLRDGVARFLTVPHRFVCLTDSRHVQCDTLPLVHGWPGWWSKIELFDGRLQGPVMYADLDTIPVGDMNALAEGPHELTVLENFWAVDRIGSGLMAWNTDMRFTYRKFLGAPDKYMQEYRTAERWGDQGFLRFNSPVGMSRWQRRWPGKVVSLKRTCRPAGGIPPAAAIVCFHGHPRPWDMSEQEWGWFRARGVFKDVSVAGARA